MTTFERVVERLKHENFLADYTFRKRDSSFIQKFDGGVNRINLDHWFSWDVSCVRPIFSVRYDIIFKWFEKFSVRRQEDRRDDYIVGFSSEMLGFKDIFEFEVTLNNFKDEYAKLVDCLHKGTVEVFSKWATLSDFYENRIIPQLNGLEPLPDGGADWLFEYLTICRIVEIGRYEELKVKVLKRAEWLMTHNERPEPNMNFYYHRLDEILEYLESLDLEKMMQTNGKKVILKK